MVSEVEPPVRPNFRSPPRRRALPAAGLLLVELHPSRPPVLATAPVATIPLRNRRRPRSSPCWAAPRASNRSTGDTSRYLNRDDAISRRRPGTLCLVPHRLAQITACDHGH